MSGGGGDRSDGFRAPPRQRGGTADGPGGGGGGIGGEILGEGDGDGCGVVGGDVDGEREQCAIAQRAPLNSPKPLVVAGLSVGDELTVELDDSGDRPVLLVKDIFDRVAGALTHRGHIALIRCIGAGWSYKAIVIAKTGAMVELRIQPA